MSRSTPWRKASSSASLDTTPTGRTRVTLAAPKRRFNLLDLQNGTTTMLGASAIPTGHYGAVRMVLNTDSSSITTAAGRVLAGMLSGPGIHWQSSTGTPTLYGIVQSPLGVGDNGASIVIDSDVGRSFQYNGNDSYTFIPWFRAVTRDATGAISGTVRHTLGDDVNVEVPGSSISAFSTPPSDTAPVAAWVVATAKTDAQGRYTVPFLVPGRYMVRVDPPTGLSVVSPGNAIGCLRHGWRDDDGTGPALSVHQRA